jgi:hypothetical protein
MFKHGVHGSATRMFKHGVHGSAKTGRETNCELTSVLVESLTQLTESLNHGVHGSAKDGMLRCLVGRTQSPEGSRSTDECNGLQLILSPMCVPDMPRLLKHGVHGFAEYFRIT